MSDYVEFENIYGQSENGNIFCIGISREENGEVLNFPRFEDGRNKGNLIRAEAVGGFIVFYNKSLSKLYYIKILDYIKSGNSKYIVCYKNLKTTVSCGNLINSCKIKNIVQEDLLPPVNNYYKKDNNIVMTIDVNNSVLNHFFQVKTIEILLDEDRELLKEIKKYSWHLVKKGNKFYPRSSKGYLHKLILKNDDKNKVIDHINGNSFDCRKDNLRLVSYSDNARNINGAGYPKKSGRGWIYYIRIKGIALNTKTYYSYEEADLIALIIQKYFNYKHREDEWYKIKTLKKEYVETVIKDIQKQYEERKRNCKNKKFSNIIEQTKEDCYKVFNKSKTNSFLISKESLNYVNDGIISKSHNYWHIEVDGVSIPIHRYLVGIKETGLKEIQVDHLNQNPDDNRMDNLIITTEKGNLANKKGAGYFKSSSSSFVVSYNCFLDYIIENSNINNKSKPNFNIEKEAKEEVFKRKWLANYIRPKFKNYEEYLNFKKEYDLYKKEGQTMDDYWIKTRFPSINDIEIPCFKQ